MIKIKHPSLNRKLSNVTYQKVFRALQIFVILGITSALYWQVNKFEFVLDDIIVITENQFVKNGVKGIHDILTNDFLAKRSG